MSAPSPPTEPQRPVRRLETDHGVTVLTNSTREPSELSRRPAPPPPPVTRPLHAPAAVTLVLPEEPEPPSEVAGSDGWLALPVVLLSGALGLVTWRRRRTRRSEQEHEHLVRDLARIGVPPRSPLAFRGAAQAPQWVSQPPSNKRTGT